jgi:hypothetical protein
MTDALSWRGENLFGADGKIGEIEEIYLDAGTSEPEWAVVKTGLLGRQRRFVPLREASQDLDGIRVPFAGAKVKEAPEIDHDNRLTEAEEAALYRHYGHGQGR